ncbi:hypothetical protein MKW94_000178 [Papaver nudicaule]|uniref:Uncharacterized protein n=1 Tax=Papaver nudicaule TaxID=74823 RepID=A0AA42AUX0_PAPNU|nr:hypothetical protein [Papaver nudicaule]
MAKVSFLVVGFFFALLMVHQSAYVSGGGGGGYGYYDYGCSPVVTTGLYSCDSCDAFCEERQFSGSECGAHPDGAYLCTCCAN